MKKELKKIYTISIVIQVALGFIIGVYEATCGTYFYETFGAEIDPKRAIFLATLLLVIRQALMTLFEMPAGALADTIGRVQVVVISWILKSLFFISLAMLWFSESVTIAFIWGSIASVLWAASYTFFNGAYSAWCVDYLKENAPEVKFSWLVSRYYNYYAIAFAVGIPVGIVFYLYGLPALIYGILALISFLCTGYCLLQMKENQDANFLDRHEISFDLIRKNMVSRLKSSLIVCKRNPILLWIIMTYGSYMFLLSLVLFLWPVYLKETTGAGKFSPQWIGLATTMAVLFVISTKFVVILNNYWERPGSQKSHVKLFSNIYLLSAVSCSMSVFLLSISTYYQFSSFAHLAVVVLLVIFCWGFMAPCYETLVNHFIGHKDSNERATIISAGSLIRSIFIMIFAIPSAGPSGAQSSIYWSIPGGLLIVSSVIAYFHIQRAEKDSRELVC